MVHSPTVGSIVPRVNVTASATSGDWPSSAFDSMGIMCFGLISLCSASSSSASVGSRVARPFPHGWPSPRRSMPPRGRSRPTGPPVNVRRSALIAEALFEPSW